MNSDPGKLAIRITMHESDKTMQKDDPTVIGKLTNSMILLLTFY